MNTTVENLRSKLLWDNPYGSFNYHEYPHDIIGWGGTDPIFRELITKKRPRMIAEVGTYKGQSAIHMANILKELNIDGHILCIDTWLGSVEFYLNPTPERQFNFKNGYPSFYYNFLANVCHSKFENYITPLALPSSLAADVLNHHQTKFDMIYIDGDHSYKSVISDLECYYPLLNDGGVFFGHDIDWWGVNDAVNEFCAKYSRKIRKTQSNFWVLENDTSSAKILI